MSPTSYRRSDEEALPRCTMRQLNSTPLLPSPPQGRVTWWNPVQKADNEFEDDEADEEEDREQLDEPKPETGPNMLTSISEDTSQCF